MINNCIIPINSDEDRDRIYQILLKQPKLRMMYPIDNTGYKKSKCFYIIDYKIRYALDISAVQGFFTELKIINLHEIFIEKELYED